jgi:hypothetical protein
MGSAMKNLSPRKEQNVKRWNERVERPETSP